MDRLTRIAVLCVLFLAVVATALPAQYSTALDTPQSPRFLLTLGSAGTPTPVEPSRTPALQRRISLDLPDATLGEALRAIADRSGIHLMYSSVVAPLDKRVRLQAENITVAEALTHVLRGTGVDVMFIAQDRATLVRQQPPTKPAAKQQNGVITGRVVESETKAPIAAAQILIDSVGRGITNPQGVYRITGVAPGRHKVSVISVGYRGSTQEVEVADGQVVTLDFELVTTPTQLSELVVTATGEQRKVELGNDITVIRVESIIQNEPVTSVTDILEGRVPGLIVQRTSGAPGDPARIRLRGVSSPLMSNDPIIIVDGIRVYSEQSDERGGNLAGSGGLSNYAAPSPLDYIDPHTIETIAVVRGPSAATMYGQDAANGVIVITTKRGTSGVGQWNISTTYGITEMVSDYPELLVRWGREVGSSTRVFCPITGLSDGNGVACVADTVVTFQMLNDPELSVLGRGRSRGVTVGVSGGSSSLTYNVTASYGDELGLVKLPAYEAARYRQRYGNNPPEWMRRPQNLQHWSASSRIMARLTDKANVSISSRLSRTIQQRSSLERQLGNLMSTYLDKETGFYYQTSPSMGLEQAEGESIIGDYYERATADAVQFVNGVNLNWRPLSWLTNSTDLGIDLIHRDDQILMPRGNPHVLWKDGRLRVGRGTSIVTTLNTRFAARIPLSGRYQLDVATGVDYTGRSINDYMTEARGLVTGTESLNGAQEINSVSQRPIQTSTFGWYVQPMLSNDRMWISTGIRLDGGSTFGSNLNLPTFPKVSVSYLISEEPFFPTFLRSAVGTFRLRAAYGQAGRQPGPVDRLRLYGGSEATQIGGNIVDMVTLERLGNTRLKPERSEEIETGFDTDLLDDRLSLSLTYYRKNTFDMLLDVPVAPSVFGKNVQIRTNVGEVRNTGLEAALNAQLIRSGPVTWGVQVNYSRNRNVVVDLGQGVEPFYTEMSNSATGIRVAEGYPLFGRWTKPILGYVDQNGDGVLVREEVILGDTLVYVGSTLPDYTASLQTTVSLLKGMVSLTAGFLYQNGLTQRNEVTRRLAPFSKGWNDPSATLAEQVATIMTPSEYNWIQTVNSLRFNTASATFHLPTSVARQFGVRALNISLQGSNLGIWTNYRGIDPHVNAHATGNNITDSGVLPMPRTWQIRVNANY